MSGYPRADEEGNQICDRCHKKSGAVIMSFFNTEYICFDCESKERAHPDYQKAKDAELAEIKKGNTNFEGIGKPADL